MIAADLGAGQTRVTLYPDFVLLCRRDDAGHLISRAYPYSDARLFARALMNAANSSPSLNPGGSRRQDQPE